MYATYTQFAWDNFMRLRYICKSAASHPQHFPTKLTRKKYVLLKAKCATNENPEIDLYAWKAYVYVEIETIHIGVAAGLLDIGQAE